ncbi:MULTISPECIES: sugar transferase [Microbacterium]|uniref:Sugar transferase n=2 Tax=Microbacterium maritypicum TaxID=33918 RepID=A0AAD3ZY95_MICMQ|nr:MULTISPECIES: sugar transferase [Microbacterium]EYT57501.1 polyprenyl glycosylphosphotransferase [Microbacterium sp. UCD-TDU]KAB1883412.1 sugar transferase [Microbacterium liquefaciens]UTT53521.1 sugar transferase [Microbacterium liquefaciens]WEF21670.1 sugar transferase [Microbacterium liquefaciens]
MTSVEDALSIARTGFVPVAAPRATKSVTRTVVTPRPSATLERRRQWERRYRMRLRTTDAAVILFAMGLTAAVELATGVSVPEVLRDGIPLAALWYLMLSALHTRDAALFRASATEYRGVAHATGLAFGIIAIVAVLLAWKSMQLTLLLGLPVGVLTLLVTRWLWRHWLQKQRAQGRFASRTLVVGNRDDVEYVVRTLHPIGASGYQVVGATLLDGNARDIVIDDTRFPVLGNVNSVSSVAAEVGADTIIVASRPEGEPEFVKQLSWQLEGTAAELVLSSRLTDVAGPRISFAPVEGLPLIQVQIPTYEGGQHLLKRALDVAVATLALIPIGLLAPVLALLIKMDSPGPVFFFQERVGRDGRRFKMVKFRSMKTDAEKQLAMLKEQNEGAGLLFKMKDDPRVTRVGKVLRKLSLDELPQFWNVLIGDMSVVGPRPPLPSEVTAYDGTVFRRLYIKPGITGLWQVSGRSDLSWDESVRLDLRYVENWSVMNDLQIMWRTAKVMVQPSGAY